MSEDPVHQFRTERSERIESYTSDEEFRAVSSAWLETAFRRQYMYNFEWLGRPVIQLPADMVAIQEAIWRTKPDLVIETGIAHGGSVILSASMLALLDVAEALETRTAFDPRLSRRRVVAIDIDIREHNRALIDAHPLSSYIDMLEGSSIDPAIIDEVAQRANGRGGVLVSLDSNHTHEHVLAELEAYAPLVTPGSYCVVFDTIVEHLPDDLFPNRPWSHGDNPTTAIREFCARLDAGDVLAADGAPLRFEIDRELDDKLILTAAPGGMLRRVG